VSPSSGFDLEATGRIKGPNTPVEYSGQRAWSDLLGGRSHELPPDPTVAPASPNGDRGDPNRIGVAIEMLAVRRHCRIEGDRAHRCLRDGSDQDHPFLLSELPTHPIGVCFKHRRIEQSDDGKPIGRRSVLDRHRGRHLCVPFKLQQ
jgi:hypothetical protein